MKVYAVSYKNADGRRVYADRDGYSTESWDSADRYLTAEAAWDVMRWRSQMVATWRVVEVHLDHETGAPFAWNEVPNKEVES